ncbi:MAG TPA: hypothetical protein VES65_11290 [Solirubrobacteraceae bacterium]|nr:hypothetical protein [Solirubrobacteraceae bacterium]
MTSEVSPVTAADFAAFVPDPAIAAQLAEQHNAAAGFTNHGAPATAVTAPVIPPRPSSSVDARVAELRSFDPTLPEATARAVAEQEDAIAYASPQQRVAMFQAGADAQADAQALASLDAIQPARSPFEYAFPGQPDSEHARTLDTGMRNDLHAARVPAEIGSRFGDLVNETAKELAGKSPDELVSWAQSNESALRRMWGAGYESRIGRVRDYLRTTFPAGSTIGGLLGDAPELFGGWQTVVQLEMLANYHARRGGK